MEFGFDLQTLLTGTLVFFARVMDVSVGTLRTISIVQGRTKTAFFLAILEISLWLMVISTVLNQIMSRPLLAVFYALGFATGNVVGIRLEKRMAFGHMILRIISQSNGLDMADLVRDSGYPVTTFQGQGRSGPVTELYIVCRRRDFKPIIDMVHSLEPEAFYITEQTGNVSKVYRPVMQPLTGWRAIIKKK